jgi:putative SOS response-associated peptidase YedK
MHEHIELSLINSELCRDVGGRASAPADSQTGRTSSPNCGGAFRLPPKGPPVINFRSESRRFPVGRCLVPASYFFEFTGTKSPKAKWKFTKANEDCFAGLWGSITTGGEAFTLLTTEPSADVARIHDRQMVVLERSDWSAWLEQTENETDLLRARLAGSLKVEQVL